MATILKLENFSKSFRSHWTFSSIEAVKNVSLEIEEGEAFGFLGRNGAGKTTTIKSILGLIHKTDGEIFYRGKPLTSPDQRSTIGYLPEHPYFYDHLTVTETLEFFAGLLGVNGTEKKKRVAEVIDRLGLKYREKNSLRELSKGWQQRVALGQAILNRPKLLLLDEPFSGLDPLGRREFRLLIHELHSSGTTIFMSSHVLSDVQDVCSRVSIMDEGKVLDSFALVEISKKFGEKYQLTLAESAENASFISTCKEQAQSVSKLSSAGIIHLTFTFAEYERAKALVERALQENLRVEHFNCAPPNLEEVFVQLTSGTDSN